MGYKEQIMRIARSALRVGFVLVNNLYCIPTYVVWCLICHPVYFISPDWFWYVEGIFFDWLLTMVAFWSYSAGYRIVESGDTIDNILDDETLVLVNHQSTSDVPLLMHCFAARRNLLEKLNWVMDAVFQFTNFGVVSTLHGDFFINAGRDRRQASLKDLESYLKTKFLPRKRKWLVLFPEGGFLRKRKEASKRYATKNNLPNLEFVTLPRMGAIQTIIDILGEAGCSQNGDEGTTGTRQLKYIIDMTIAYPNGEPLDLGDIITGYRPECEIRMHYKVYPILEVPHKNPEEFQSWLYKLYIEKNNLLGHYYRTGAWDSQLCQLDINEFKSGSSVSKDDIRGSDVVDEACRVPSMVDEEGSLLRRVPSLDSIQSKLSVSELIHDEKANSREQLLIDESSFDQDVDDKTRQLNARILHLDLLRVTLIHLLFILSTSLHVVLIQRIYSYVVHS